ncbi:hypothetical protein R6Q59_010390 [Mikania micrantha]
MNPNHGDSLDRNIDEETRTTKHFLILDGHEEADEESPKNAKFFFSTAVQNWDAEFYVKVDNNIALILNEKLNEIIQEILKEKKKEKERLNRIIAELEAEKEKQKEEKEAMSNRMSKIEDMLKTLVQK